MTIEPGQFKRTRDGRKARIYATDGTPNLIHGAVFHHDGWRPVTWTQNGCDLGIRCAPQPANDLIADWIDAPVVPWADYPKWCRACAMDEAATSQGVNWYGYSVVPVFKYSSWSAEHGDGFMVCIPPEFSPKFTGAAKDSLCVRPEGV